jgi:hypothetical protein
MLISFHLGNRLILVGAGELLGSTLNKLPASQLAADLLRGVEKCSLSLRVSADERTTKTSRYQNTTDHK